jgi:hypothetical protein
MNLFSYIYKFPYGAVGHPALLGQEIEPLKNAVRWLVRNCPILGKNGCPKQPDYDSFFKKFIPSKQIGLKF